MPEGGRFIPEYGEGVFHRSRLYQAAIERWKDARALFEQHRYFATMYLAGYVVECYLKFFICERFGFIYVEDWEAHIERQTGRRPHLRSVRGHDLELLLHHSGLKNRLRRDRQAHREFTIVNQWNVTMRYDPRGGNIEHAERFLEAVDFLHAWLRAQL